MRWLLVAVVLAAVALGAAGPAASAAEPPPPYEGDMRFPAIEDTSGPEEFSWEVQLTEEQELRAIDERRAGVYWKDGPPAFQIEAVAAHDANGADVPTTLAVSGENVITLTVHHRAGNPAAGGAPFAYPISAGVGWEGGFKTYPVQMPPTEPAPAVVAVAPCLVPKLTGRSLKATRRALKKAHCSLGAVRGQRVRGAKVVKQFRKAGSVLPAGGRVAIKLDA